MKITLNLSAPASLRDRWALAWAVPTALAGLLIAVALGRASLQEYRDYRGMQQQVFEVQMRAADLRNQEAAIRKKLEDPAYRDLLRQARFVNNLIDQRELSLSELSARVAGLLPAEAQLTALGLTSPKRPGDVYTVKMGITARGEDAIQTFINDLEDAPDFKDVSILNQGFQEEAAQGEQVNIICTARYLPGAEKAFEEASRAAEAGSEKPKVAREKPRAKGQKKKDKTAAAKVGSPK
jgi:hypothetical protein